MDYGDFIGNGKQFKITTPDIPRNWYNYMWNDNYITYFSQVGAGRGFLQDKLGRRIESVAERSFHIIDGDTNWGICGLPVNQKNDDYNCIHSIGYTVVHTAKNGIATDLRAFVPNNDNCEIYTFKIKNNSNEKRYLKILSYCGTDIDGAYVRQGYNLSVADFDKDLNGIVSRNYCDFNDVKMTDYYTFMAITEKADGYDCTVNAFVGPYGSLANPKALENGGCTNTAGVGEKLGFALQKNVQLEPNEETEFSVICGVEFSLADAVSLKEKYSNKATLNTEFENTKSRYLSNIEGVDIKTPDEQLNYMFNWLKTQSNLGSRWARVRHNGFRDTVSDCECLACVNPELALERFKRILSYQYSNGYAPRTFINGEIRNNNFSDNAVWITFTAYSILKELGNISILDIVVPFNDGTTGTIYEHIKRSVEFLYNFKGLHNLIKIWCGDWNDCMNWAGKEGKGVSIWLSIAWYRANKMFGEIAEIYGKLEDAKSSKANGEGIRKTIEEIGWDGEYYICAITDDDEKR